jgi:hypothetical protein
MKSKLFIPFFMLVATISYAQVKWPAITQQNKPWTRWWWEGSAVDKKNLTAAMELYNKAGLGGLEITPIYGIKGHESKFLNFLSPQWMEMLQHTLSEAKRLNMGIDLANATGWPFGGPWITPEDACKNINIKTYAVKAGEQLTEPVTFTQQPFYRSESRAEVDMKALSYPVATNKNLQAYAFDQVRYEKQLPLHVLMAYNENGETIDLTSKVDAAGKLNWTAPTGNWKLTALFVGWHGKMVERAAPGGEGDVIDHFNATALQHYLKKFDHVFKGKDLSGIRAYFNDSYEVDDARGQSNWTPDFFAQFQKRRGYDLKKYLPQLFARDSSDISRRVLTDYRQTVSDMLLDNFTKPWQHWATAQHKLIRNQSHGSPANILDLYAVVDIPETEGEDILRFKFATSTAHVMGKPLASSETATWLNEHFQSSLGDVKKAVDKYFVGGVNHVFWHGTNYSPQNEPWPGWLFYAAVHFTPANSFWKDFGTLNNYVARVQSFLQQGKPDDDVLLYYPYNDKISELDRDMLQHFDGMRGFERTVFNTSALWLLQKGYAFDLISDKQVQQVKSNGAFLQTGGINFKTIVLADVKTIPLEAMKQLRQLAQNGAAIVFYQHLPQDVPGFFEFEKRKSELQSLIGAVTFGAGTNSGVQKAAVGKGYFLLGNDLSSLLAEAKVTREQMVDKGLQYSRRTMPNGHCYFISNSGTSHFEGWVALEAKEPRIAMYDAMMQRSGVARTRVANGKTEVWLVLDEGQSCILQTSAMVTGAAFPYDFTNGVANNIQGEWKVSFVSGGPVLPSAVTTRELKSWTEFGNDDLKRFSGTALYSIHFNRPGNAKEYLLELTRVEETAEIFINGKKLATLIGPVFRVQVPASYLKSGDNLLEIKVTNGMANRIVDLDKRGVEWKKFYNTNFPARLAENRNANNLFTAVKWSPKASGLLGQVILYSPLK